MLLLLTFIGKPLQAKCCGPYVIEKRVGEVDYVVSTLDRRKTKRVIHVNLLKKYLTRDSDIESAVNVNVVMSVGIADKYDCVFCKMFFSITWKWHRKGN